MADDALGDPEDARFQRDRELLGDRETAAAETRTEPTRARSEPCVLALSVSPWRRARRRSS